MAQVASELISVTKDEKLADSKYIKDLELGDKKQSDINKDSLSGGVYNVTKLHPRQSGYHTITTAIAAIPQALRCVGMVITYQTASDSWETKQFKGALSDWADSSKWEDFGGGEAGDGVYDISEAYPNLSPFASLQAALTAFTDTTKKKGGMTIKFIQGIGDDAKYVQYRYVGTSIAGTDFENEENWMEEGVSNSYDDVLNIKPVGGTPASGGEVIDVTMVLDTSSYTDPDYPDDSSYNISDGHYYIGTDNNSDSLKRFKDVNAKTYRVDVFNGDAVTAALTPIEGDDTHKLDYYGESNGGALNSNSNGFRIDKTVSAITVELLFRVESIDSNLTIFAQNSNLFQAALATAHNSRCLRLSIITGNTSEYAWDGPVYVGNIYHVVFIATNDGNTIIKKVYLNGSLKGTTSDTKTIYTTLSDSLLGGTAITHFTRRIWLRDLSDAEVSTLYNGGNPIEADISNLETELVSNLQSSGLSATAWHDSAEDQDYPLGENVVLEPNNPFATGGGDTPELYQVICFSSKDDVYTLENGVQVNSDSSQVYNAIAPFDGYAYISTLNSVRYIKLTTKYTPPTPATKRSKRLDDIEENIESLRKAVESEVEPQTNAGNVYDVSKANNKSYSSLQSALADVPAGYQHGWVTIAYKDAYDVYKKVALIKDVWSTESSDWVDDIHDEFFLKELKYTNSYPTPVLDSSINNGFYYIAASGVLQTLSNTAASACVTYRFPIQKGDIVYCTSNTGSTIRAVISFGDEQRTNFQVGYVPTANQWVNTKYSAESPIDGYAYITKGIGANNPIPDGTALAVMVIPHSSKLISSLLSVKREILYPYFDVVNKGHGNHDCTFWDDNTILSGHYEKNGKTGAEAGGNGRLYWRNLQNSDILVVKADFYEEGSEVRVNQLKSIDYKFGKLLIGSGRAKMNEATYEEQGSYIIIFNDVANWKEIATDNYGTAPQITLGNENCGTYKKINFDISLGVKSYAFWAQRDDTIYLNTNFFRDIYLIRLGKGTHNLGSGTFESVDNELLYNGSYKVINHWHQDEDWQQGSEPLAAHGGEYKNGHLYLAVNKTDSCVVLKCILGYDGTLKFDEIHLDEYIVGNNTQYQYRYIDGLCFDSAGKMYCQPLNVGTLSSTNTGYYIVAEV